MTADSLTVLLVDDEEIVRTLLRRMLEHLNLRVFLASDAESALAFFKNTEHPIDLVIADMRLPGMSGVDLARELRRIDSSTAVLLMSGRFEGQPSDFIELDKPFTFEKLESRIAEALTHAAPRLSLAPAR